jgi:UDP-N-acetylmuramate dehydrogenase
MGIGGPAEFLARPTSVEAVEALLAWSRQRGLPVWLLGRGTNLLVDDAGVRGLVMAVGPTAFRTVEVRGNRLVAGAGAALGEAVRTAIRAGLAGLEGLVGIPGSVGGAVRMNAGTRAGEIAAVTAAVTAVDPARGPVRIEGADLGLGYRTSSLGNRVVVEAEFKLTPADPAAMRERAAALAARRRAAQPLGERSAGCIFRNPAGTGAGRLIDEAGLKGTRIGGMAVSERHANFLVNRGGATFDDAMRLIDLARETVRRRFGVDLHLEVEIWRDGGPRAGTP